MDHTRESTATWNHKGIDRAIKIQTKSAGTTPLYRSGRDDVERASDLRRRHARSMVEQLVELTAALPDPDRALMLAVYRDGRTVTDLAPLLGEPPPAIRRRVRALVKRVMSPPFRYVAAASGALAAAQRDARHPSSITGDRGAGSGSEPVVKPIASSWPRMRRRVADLCVIRGLSQRAAAAELGASVHVVRRHLDAVTALVEEATA